MSFLPEALSIKSSLIALPGQNTARAVPASVLPLGSITNDESTIENKEKTSKDYIQRFQKERQLAEEFEKSIEESEIESAAFNLYTTEEIDDMAVVHVVSSENYGPNTVRDPRMGPHSENQPCQTCSKTQVNCIGHIGKIVIPPIPHPLNLQTIINILSVVCNSCGSLYFNKTMLEFNGILRFSGLNRLREMKKLVKPNQKCIRVPSKSSEESTSNEKKCNVNPKYSSAKTSKDKAKIFYTYPNSSEKYYRTAIDVYNIFNAISDSDAKLMGFTQGAHPRNLIINRIIVIPLSARPDIYQGGRMMPSDFTLNYQDMIQIVNEYDKQETSETRKEDLLDSLVFKYGHTLSNSDGKYKQGQARAYRSMKQLVQGKRGVVLNDLGGKRTNFAGRTVANGGSYLRVDELGIPKTMASELTRPISVTTYNREEMQTLYDTGKVNNITMKHGTLAGKRALVSEALKKKFPNYKLQNGDIVERHLQDGDIAIIGRQPTLRKQNMIALRVRLIDDFVVRINLSITTPLNADFDGDELNFHIPQTTESYVEAEQLLSVGHNLMSAQTNNPMMSITYDTLTGAYLLTEPEYNYDVIRPRKNIEYLKLLNEDYPKERLSIVQEIEKETDETKKKDLEKQLVKFDEKVEKKKKEYNTFLENDYVDEERKKLDPDIFVDVIMELNDMPQMSTLQERLKKHGIEWGSRRALFSASLPENFFYDKNVEGGIIIRDGILIQGLINKEAIGSKDGRIISEMYKQLGAPITIDFMSHVQFLMHSYLMHRGFTVGLADCISDNPKFYEELKFHLEDAKMKVEVLSMTPGQKSNPILAEQTENKIMETLDQAKSTVDRIALKYIPSTNNLQIMSAKGSGAKGDAFNSIQIISTIGQQKEGGKRMVPILSGNRVLPVFKPGDIDPTARGFCMNSFASQLTAEEFFLHNKGGRESIINTSINTASTGALQNTMIKSVEDVHVSGSGAVCSASGSIVQFSYADGFDPAVLTSTRVGKDDVPFFRNIYTLANNINAKYSK